MTMTPIPAGQVFYVSTGCYSDYSVSAVFRATADIDLEALKAEFFALHPESERNDYRFDSYSTFMAFLSATGLVEEIDARELHLGDYNDMDEMWTDADQ
jgi:hypothetical protein